MKKFLLIMLLAAFVTSANSQVLKNIGDKAKQKINQRIDQKIDKAMNNALDSVDQATKKTTDQSTANAENSGKTTSGAGKTASAPQESLKAYSRYDFIQGEKVIGYEDFSSAAIGDFPERWNTNATAEVVTLNSRDGKWLKINKEGVWMPEFITNLPANFTLEFDLGVTNGFDGSNFVLNIGNLKNPQKEYTDFYHNVAWRHGYTLHIQLKPSNGRVAAWSRMLGSTDGNYAVNNTVEFKNWDNEKNNFAHVALWRQNQRLRIYVNGEKVFDVPRAFDGAGKYNAITFAMQGSYKPDEYQYFLGNIRLAVGAPDTRNKLISEGKFVTTGITFDPNSDKLKPASYGVLKEIAGALSENATVKIRIVGHTDSDGEDAKNLDLSKRRAAAVKEFLVKEFAIDAARIETEGMGETKPAGDNKTAEGKAQNRRVEFIKL